MSHSVLKSLGTYKNSEIILEEVRIDNLSCFINLSTLNQGKIPEILIELSTGCHHYNAMIRVTRKFMELFGVETARITAVRLARALGIEDYEAVERGDIELRIRRKPSHYPEWVSQNIDSVINAFSEVLASLGIINQSMIAQPPVTQSQREVTQTPVITSQPVTTSTLAASVIRTYGSVGNQNLVLRSLGGNTHVELCLERTGGCKPLVTVRAKPLEVVIHEDAVKAFGENRAIEYATWLANALYISNYEINETGNEVVLRSREGADNALTKDLVRVMDIIASKYLSRE
ncbi:hypothetical protein [Vulcanisaeta sp. JCM 16159]|uniref:hypothetical protein n=1 Tax=Vulcanisaeta sp. JCM 16159 TaxID=1295371 RepID=UPI0006D1C877|nr:hypothetical protein [Vulcanisaeta sp. JCM 16159]